MTAAAPVPATRPADDDADLLPAKRPAPALRAGQVVDAGDVDVRFASRRGRNAADDDIAALASRIHRLSRRGGSSRHATDGRFVVAACCCPRRFQGWPEECCWRSVARSAKR